MLDTKEAKLYNPKRLIFSSKGYDKDTLKRIIGSAGLFAESYLDTLVGLIVDGGLEKFYAGPFTDEVAETAAFRINYYYCTKVLNWHLDDSEDDKSLNNQSDGTDDKHFTCVVADLPADEAHKSGNATNASSQTMK